MQKVIAVEKSVSALIEHTAWRDDDARAAEAVRAHLAAGVGLGNGNAREFALGAADDVLQDDDVRGVALGNGGQIDVEAGAIGFGFGKARA